MFRAPPRKFLFMFYNELWCSLSAIRDFPALALETLRIVLLFAFTYSGEHLVIHLKTFSSWSLCFGVVVRMSILDTKVAGSNLSINIFSP